MNHRQGSWLTDKCTIKRYHPGMTNEDKEPVGGGEEPVAEDVPCTFNPPSTSFVREDVGERVEKPATLTLGRQVDVKGGDTIAVDGIADAEGTKWEVRGVEETVDHRRGTSVSVEIELERAD